MLAEAPDDELLSRLLGRKTNVTTPLGRLLGLQADELLALGFTEPEPEIIQVVSEIARRYQPPVSSNELIADPRDVVSIVRSHAGENAPGAAMLFLDRASRLIHLKMAVSGKEGQLHSADSIAGHAEATGTNGLYQSFDR